VVRDLCAYKAKTTLETPPKPNRTQPKKSAKKAAKRPAIK
jgi:hypothetical protein